MKLSFKKIFVCLSVFVIVLSTFCMTSFAAEWEQVEGYDSFTYIKSYKNHYTVDVETSTGIYRYVIYTDSTIVPSEPRLNVAWTDNYNVLVVTNDSGSGIIQEYYFDKIPQIWTRQSSHVGSSPKHYTITDAEYIDIVSSDLDILDEKGDVFFQQTPVNQELSVEIQGLTMKTLGEVIPKLSPTVSILVLCGVGCLALLIGLKILPMVLKKFI